MAPALRPLASLASVLVGAALLLGLSGCSSGGDIPVRKVLVDLEPSAVELDRAAVRERLDRALANSPTFKVTEGGKDGLTLRLTVFMATAGAPNAAADAGEGHPAIVSLGVDVEGTSNGRRIAYFGRGNEHGENDHADEGLLLGLLEKAVGTALNDIVSVRKLEGASDEELLKVAQDQGASSSRREHAVRALGVRRVSAATPVLTGLLEDDSRELTDAALAALTLLGDPAGVDAVIQYSTGKPSLVRRQAIEAVRAMGGHKGQAWLFTLSTGHPDPEVQLAATSALASIASLEPSDEGAETTVR